MFSRWIVPAELSVNTSLSTLCRAGKIFYTGVPLEAFFTLVFYCLAIYQLLRFVGAGGSPLR